MESNKENNPVNNNLSLHLNPKNIGFFNGDDYLCYVYKKTEKLVSALYMVSNLFSEHEPLKWSFREKGLSMLALNVSLANAGMSDREVVINNIFSVVLEILSMLEVAFFAGLISTMNHSILTKEFNSLLTLIEERERHEKEKNGYVLSENFFNIQEKIDSSGGLKSNNGASVVENNLNTFTKDSLKAPVFKDNVYKGQPKQPANERLNKTNQASQPLAPSTSVKDMALRKDSRKAIILNLLKKQDNLTIKDFTRVIDNCSEKTIQRELLQLVSEGVLKKEGERRWSRYSLIQ